jgi:hypothetical protein
MDFVLIGSTSTISPLQSMSSWLIFKQKGTIPTLYCCLYVVSIDAIFSVLSSYMETLADVWKNSKLHGNSCPSISFFYWSISRFSQVFTQKPTTPTFYCSQLVLVFDSRPRIKSCVAAFEYLRGRAGLRKHSF